MKKTLLPLALITSVALSNWEAGIGIGTYSEDLGIAGVSDPSITIGSLSIAYRQQLEDGWTISPILRLGQGLSEDTLTVSGTDYDLEIDRFHTIGAELEKEFTPKFSGIFSINYGSRKVTIKDPSGLEVSDSDTEFGIGIGARYLFTEEITGKVTLEKFDEATVFLASLNYSF